ncbi:helix-turn-helix domain-containing protein, partial [Patescibacteria group bacterium]|nr:helix-turn-helix domain-containing protein [Patescibacteria group bacterium]
MPIPAHRKEYAVFAVINEKKSVTAIARELGVARKTVYSWIKRYKKTSPRNKPRALEPKYAIGAKHPRAYRFEFKNRLIKEVVRDPGASVTVLSKKLKAGRHAVYNLLSELKLSTKHDREAFKRLYKAPGRLYLDVKGEIVRKIVEERRPVTEISREFNVARKTLYEWVRRYEEEGKVLEKYVFGFEHPKAFSQSQEKVILNKVARAPELSIHKLAKDLGFSSHGIFNVLKRYDLTYKDARLSYAEAQRPVPKSVFARFLDRTRLVWEQFI